MDLIYTKKNGQKKNYGEGQHLKISRNAFEELLEDYEEKTQEIDDKILSTAKNRFVKEKNEFVRRKNFISTLKYNLISLI